MPAALRITLRPPSHPTTYLARSDWPPDSSTSTPVSSWAIPVTSRPAIDRHRQLADPAGQYALDVVLPQREPVGVPGGKVADVQRNLGEPAPPAPPAPAKGTDQRFRADQEPRWCVNADRLRASQRGPGWRAARQWQRRPPPMPTHLPTSALSGPLRQPPPHGRISVRPLGATHPAPTRHALRNPRFSEFRLRPAILRHDPGLAASPQVRYMLKVTE